MGSTTANRRKQTCSPTVTERKSGSTEPAAQSSLRQDDTISYMVPLRSSEHIGSKFVNPCTHRTQTFRATCSSDTVCFLRIGPTTVLSRHEPFLFHTTLGGVHMSQAIFCLANSHTLRYTNAVWMCAVTRSTTQHVTHVLTCVSAAVRLFSQSEGCEKGQLCPTLCTALFVGLPLTTTSGTPSLTSHLRASLPSPADGFVGAWRNPSLANST